MVPPGWSPASRTLAEAPQILSENEWILLLENFSRKIGISPELTSLIADGVLVCAPAILLHFYKGRDQWPLNSVHCAYVTAGPKLSHLVDQITWLLNCGVRSFSIYAPAVDCHLQGAFEALESLTVARRVTASFTFWCEMHTAQLYDHVVQKRAEAMVSRKETQKQSSDTNSFPHISRGRAVFTVGVLVPQLFFNMLLSSTRYTCFNHADSITLNSKHCEEYEREYTRLAETSSRAADSRIPKNSTIGTCDPQQLLSLILHASVSRREKYLLQLRDSCYSMQASKAALHSVWNDEINDAIVFPNHLGEVPSVVANTVMLQFAAFGNADRALRKQKRLADVCCAAYTLLSRYLEVQLSSGWQEHSHDNVSLSAAVGVVGLEEANDGRQVTPALIDKTVFPILRGGCTVFPMRGSVAAGMWAVTAGVWSSFEEGQSVLHDEGSVMLPCGNFARHLLRAGKRADLISAVELSSEASAFVLSRDQERMKLATETPLEEQVHRLRKICQSFFSPASMRLVFTHKDAQRFGSLAEVMVFLSHLVVSNARRNCPVLLPEIACTDSHQHVAEQVKRKGEHSMPVRIVQSACLKRKRSETVSSALSSFFSGVLAGVRDSRMSPANVPAFALQLMKTLSNFRDGTT